MTETYYDIGCSSCFLASCDERLVLFYYFLVMLLFSILATC